MLLQTFLARLKKVVVTLPFVAPLGKLLLLLRDALMLKVSVLISKNVMSLLLMLYLSLNMRITYFYFELMRLYQSLKTKILS